VDSNSPDYYAIILQNCLMKFTTNCGNWMRRLLQNYIAKKFFDIDHKMTFLGQTIGLDETLKQNSLKSSRLCYKTFSTGTSQFSIVSEWLRHWQSLSA